jgi:uncharacterized membrane protein
VNNWKVIFATVVIFGAGVITGGLLVNYVKHSNPKPPRVKSTAPVAVRTVVSNQPTAVVDNKLRPPEILSKQFLQQLDDSLHLKAEQRETIQKIIGEGQNQIRKVVQDARLEIRVVLNPEQRKQFDELVKRPFRKPVLGTNAIAALPAATNFPAGAATAP